MFKTTCDKLNKHMSLQSSIFSDYFNTLMNNNNIKSMRNGMKILIFYCYCEIISSHISERGVIFRPSVALVIFCIFFFIFIASKNVVQTVVMMRLSSIMVVICMTYTVILGADNMEVMEVHYSLSVLIILMMYTLFRLKFLLTMLLSVIYIMIFVLISNYRKKFIEKINMTEFYDSPLTSIRAFRVSMSNKEYFLTGQCILFCLIYLTALYLRFFNSIRRKSAFMKLTQKVEANMKIDSAIEVQQYWVDATFPTRAREKILHQVRNNNLSNLCYCEQFDNVSILFADIVGFDQMISHKTVTQVVLLMNDLFDRLDDLGTENKCEKICTMGDCYYCVSGCPTPESAHAIHCIEMGIGIIRMIVKFNFDYKEKIEMRIGVHSGQVIAAILGNHRFRFDIISYDATIAHRLKCQGKSGSIHISEDTYSFVQNLYKFEEGHLLEIQKVELVEMDQLITKPSQIQTYFLTLDSSDILRPEKILRVKHRPTFQENLSNKMHVSFTIQKYLKNKQSRRYILKDQKVKRELKLIEMLQHDPDQTIEFFKNPPINKVTQMFLDNEIEHQYLFHTTDQVEPLRIVSIKLALLIDAIASLIYSSVLLLVAFTMIPDIVEFQLDSLMIYCSSYLVVVIVAFISLFYKSEINNTALRFIYCFCSHPVMRLFFSVYISALPSVLIFSFHETKLVHLHYSYTAAYLTLTIFGLIGSCISSATLSIVKLVTIGLFTVLPIQFVIFGQKGNTNNSPLSVINCTSYITSALNYRMIQIQCNFTFQLLNVCLLVYYLTRENERIIRMHFFIAREADIRKDEAIREKSIAERLFYNIVPKPVFSEIVGDKHQKQMSFNYAKDFEKAGIIFGYISNFLLSFDREDIESGNKALKLLNMIICKFDNMYVKTVYKKLEKIRSINNCYMVASGLIDDGDQSDDHLKCLMSFAVEMHHNFKLIIEKNRVTTTELYLKIGYNFGPVLTGLIGTSKPIFDVWGDTVHVADLMCQTSPDKACILVPDYVAETLKKDFEFVYHGNVTVTENSNIDTYLVVITPEDGVPLEKSL